MSVIVDVGPFDVINRIQLYCFCFVICCVTSLQCIIGTSRVHDVLLVGGVVFSGFWYKPSGCVVKKFILLDPKS
jgi:hypothetical protein